MMLFEKEFKNEENLLKRAKSSKKLFIITDSKPKKEKS